MVAFEHLTEFGDLRVDALFLQCEALDGCLDDFSRKLLCWHLEIGRSEPF